MEIVVRKPISLCESNNNIHEIESVMDYPVSQNSTDKNSTILSTANRYLEEKIRIVEESKIPLRYFFLTFIFAVIIRNFLEASLYHDFHSMSAVFNLDTVIHFFSSYIALGLGITLLLYFAVDKPILKVFKVVMPTFLILIVAPLVDFSKHLVTGKAGIHIGYITESDLSSLFFRYVTFFGNFESRSYGVTTGMKIEILLIILLGSVYILISCSSKIKAVVFAFLMYSLIFWGGIAFPSVLRLTFPIVGLGDLIVSPAVITQMFFLLSVALGTIILYLHDKQGFISIIKDVRPFRLLHYELMFILGMVLALKVTGKPFQFSSQIIKIVLIVVTIALAWLYSVFVNNIEDIEIDRITNEDRPLISGNMKIETYQKLSWVLLGSLIVIAYTVDIVYLFLILTFVAGYFIYSAPPLRLKKVLILSKTLIALCSLVLVVTGYWMINYSLSSFPSIVVVIVMLGFTLLINFIDIKDYEGDKEAGIKTLPVLMGLKKSKVVIGIAFIATYLSGYFILKNFYMILPLALIGCLEFYLINKEDYDERSVFIVYIISLLFLIIMYFRL